MIFHFYIPSSSSPKGLYLISHIDTTAIDISNKLKITCGDGNIINPL